MKRTRGGSEDLDESDLDLLEEDEESKVDEEKLRFFSILGRSTKEQNERYEVMHATYLYNPRLGESDRVNEKFEGLIKNIIGSTPTDDMLLALAAAAKIYVGEIVESALEVSKENKDLGPLTPIHIQEARRRLKKTFKRIL